MDVMMVWCVRRPSKGWLRQITKKTAVAAIASLGLTAFGLPVVAHADIIQNPVAVFSGLDKITGRIITFEVNLDETVRFGALQITPRVCNSRPATESPNTTSFVEVDEVTLDNEIKPLFSGWMFASSPGLHGIEHPVFDVWLLECKGGTTVTPENKPQTAPATKPR